MLSEKVAALQNEQVNKEFYSAYLYLDFSNYFEARGLDGFANWYKIKPRRSGITPCCSISTSTTTAPK